jgi:hypothetical protein
VCVSVHGVVCVQCVYTVCVRMHVCTVASVRACRCVCSGGRGECAHV